MLAVNILRDLESCLKKFVHVISFHVIQSPFLKFKRNHDNFYKKIRKIYVRSAISYINLYSLALPFKRSHSKTVNYSCYPLTLEDIFFVHIFPFVNMLVI